MYICYVDESGHCGQKFNPEQPVEVLCGVRTDITKLFKTQRQHAAIIQILQENGIPLSELKACDTYAGRKQWAGVPPEVRDRMFELVLEWADARFCKFTVCPIDCVEFFERKENGCEISNRFCYPYEAGAINIVLSLQRLHRSMKSNKGKTLLVFDEQQAHDKNILHILEGDLSFTDGYTGYQPKPRAKQQPSRLDQIIDVPHFSKSHLSVLIQLADWTAFIANKYLLLTVYGQEEKYIGEFKMIEEWYAYIGDNRITHTAIDPPGKDPLCLYFRSIRPPGWSAKDWAV